MQQKRILELLQEASQPNCTLARANQIELELREGCPKHVDQENPRGGERENGYEEGRCDGHDEVINSLFVDTFEKRRELLPSLFPLFAMICGDKDDNMMRADIDWSLLPQ